MCIRDSPIILQPHYIGSQPDYFLFSQFKSPFRAYYFESVKYIKETVTDLALEDFPVMLQSTETKYPNNSMWLPKGTTLKRVKLSFC